MAEAHRVDSDVGDMLIEVKTGVFGLLAVRDGLIQLARAIAERDDSRGYLVLSGASIKPDSVRHEWERTTSVLRPDLVERLHICVHRRDGFTGIPDDVDEATKKVLLDELSRLQSTKPIRPAPGDAGFIVLKVLLHHWFVDGTPVTTERLMSISGYSYPTVANAIASLGSLVERTSDRRIRLRWFPRDEFARLLAVSPRVRRTARYADRSAQPRTPEAHVHRLERLRPIGVAIGGVLGAKHYFPELDLVGTPRLDISLHSLSSEAGADLVAKLDPALKRVDDPLEPASVVVHQVRHAETLFVSRQPVLYWADRVECLMDLHETHLEAQAIEFLQALESRRPALLDRT